MATWIAHLRIADKILKELPYKRLEFLAGNIGPDSGLPNEDYSRFDPPKSVTHFLDENKRDHPASKISSSLFYDNHLQNDITDYKIGYYAHLITDVRWSILLVNQRKENPDLYKQLKEDPSFIWEIKKDWYGLDFKYVYEINSDIFNEFMTIKAVPDHLDYFPKGALDIQLKNIQNYYSDKGQWPQGQGIYLKEKEMDTFVEETALYIIEKLKKEF